MALVIASLVVLVFINPAFAQTPACSWDFETSPASLPNAAYRPVAATVGDYFYFIGGYAAGVASDDVYAYSPLTDTWETKTSMPGARGGACGAAIDGKIYVVAGDFSSTLYIYDTETDTWETGSSHPEFMSGCMAASIDGLLYVAGGRRSDDTVLASTYAYDPLLDSWSAMADMPAGKYFGKGVAYYGYFFAVGGWNNSTTYSYDPNANTWATGTAMPSNANDANLIAPEYTQSYYFWTFGLGNQWNPDDVIRGYNITTSTWYEATAFGTMPTPVFASGADNFHDAVFIIAGGATGNSVATDTVQVFRYCLPYISPTMTQTEVVNYRATEITITGLHFDDETGSTYYLASSKKAPGINFDSWTVVDAKTITATVPSSLSTGTYSIYADTYWTDHLGTAPEYCEDCLTVTAPMPLVSVIDPAYGEQDEQVSVTVTGNHFFGTPDVVLNGPDKAEIAATNVVVVDADEITADFDLTDAAIGDYHVVITTTNGSGQLNNGFQVLTPADDDTVDDDTVDDDTVDDDTVDDDTVDDDTVDDDTVDDDTVDDDTVDDDDTTDDDTVDDDDDDATDDDADDDDDDATDDDDDDDDATGGGDDDDDDDDGCGC